MMDCGAATDSAFLDNMIASESIVKGMQESKYFSSFESDSSRVTTTLEAASLVRSGVTTVTSGLGMGAVNCIIVLPSAS